MSDAGQRPGEVQDAAKERLFRQFDEEFREYIKRFPKELWPGGFESYDAQQTRNNSLPGNSLPSDNSQAPRQDQAESIAERDPNKPPRTTPTKLEIPNDDSQGIRPIPSINGMEKDPYDRPWEPHEEPVYTMLFIRGNRNEARRLRDQIRYHGFGILYQDWILRKKRDPLIGPLGGLKFVHRTSPKTTISVAWGNREVVNETMERETLRPGGIRQVLLLQCDGGKVRVFGLDPKCNDTDGAPDYTFIATVLDLFKDFEV